MRTYSDGSVDRCARLRARRDHAPGTQRQDARPCASISDGHYSGPPALRTTTTTLGRRDHQPSNPAIAERERHRARAVKPPTTDGERGDHLVGIVGLLDPDQLEVRVLADVVRAVPRRDPVTAVERAPQSSSSASSVNTAMNAAESPWLVVSMNACSGAGTEVATRSPGHRVGRLEQTCTGFWPWSLTCRAGGEPRERLVDARAQPATAAAPRRCQPASIAHGPRRSSLRTTRARQLSAYVSANRRVQQRICKDVGIHQTCFELLKPPGQKSGTMKLSINRA